MGVNRLVAFVYVCRVAGFSIVLSESSMSIPDLNLQRRSVTIKASHSSQTQGRPV